MKIAMLLAMIVGYGGGLLAGYGAVKKMLEMKAITPVVRRVIVVLGVLSVIPAIFIGTVIGGTFGGGIGESASMALGFGSAGVPLGLGIGLFVVISMTIIGFGIVGKLLGWAVSVLYERNAP